MNPVRAERQKRLAERKARADAYRAQVAAHCTALGYPNAINHASVRYIDDLAEWGEAPDLVASWLVDSERAHHRRRLTAAVNRAAIRRRVADRHATRELLDRIDHESHARANLCLTCREDHCTCHQL